MFLQRQRQKEKAHKLDNSYTPLEMNEYVKKFDLNGSGCVIRDTKYDHMTKINFRNTLKQLAVNSNISASNYSKHIRSASSTSKSKFLALDLFYFHMIVFNMNLF